MRLKDNTNPFIHVNPPYQLMVIHSSKLIYPPRTVSARCGGASVWN